MGEYIHDSKHVPYAIEPFTVNINDIILLIKNNIKARKRAEFYIIVMLHELSENKGGKRC